MAKLAFLGTGLIGKNLALASLDRGHEVTVWNRSPGKTDELEAAGAKVAASPEDAARGQDRIHIAVSDDVAVEAVLSAIEDNPKGVIVDHTTTGPRPTKARALQLLEDGIDYLHAPVFMSPAMCRKGGGMMLAAGPEDVYAKVKDGLAEMTGSVKYLGTAPDRAAAFKLFGNAMIFTIAAGLSDVFAMAKSLGIEPEDARGLFDVFNPVGTLSYRGANMAKGDYTVSFEMSMARKDTRLMLESVDDDVTLCVLPAIAARMDALIERGLGDLDFGALSIDAVPPRS